MQKIILDLGRDSSDTDEEYDAFMKRYEAYAHNDPQYHEWVRVLLEMAAQAIQ